MKMSLQNKQFEIQQQIKENSQGIQDRINELHKWERDVKAAVAENCQTKKNENSYPVRIPRENVITNGYAKPTASKQNNLTKTQSDANWYKDLGNQCFKNNDYATAIENYTKAISIKEDPVFYSNRAFCYLKLEQYNDCIADCSSAVTLDPKLVKGFYRRMQANEVLCNFDLALKDCKEVLKLDPKNIDAIQANRRLSSRIAGKDLSQSTSNQAVSSWSKLDASVKDVAFVRKPPHLRSKKPLRRIIINEPNNNNNPPDKKSKDEENEAFKSTVVGNSKKMSNGIADKRSIIPLKPPNSSAQFYTTWRELNDDSQKYSYLKMVKITELSKLLGSSFDTGLFKELLKILSESFVRDNIPVTGILKQIIINNQFTILKMFMDTEDKNAFEKLLKYVESNETNADDLKFIKDNFNSL